jgi:hypothetical protein
LRRQVQDTNRTYTPVTHNIHTIERKEERRRRRRKKKKKERRKKQ